jgi:hypothetical protein
VTAWLPAVVPGTGRGRAARLLALLGGIAVAALLVTIARGAVPPVEVQAGLLVGVALLGCVAVAALPPLRGHAAGLLLGGLSLAVAVGFAGPSVDPASLLVTVAATASGAFVLAVVLGSLARGGVQRPRAGASVLGASVLGASEPAASEPAASEAEAEEVASGPVEVRQ